MRVKAGNNSKIFKRMKPGFSFAYSNLINDGAKKIASFTAIFSLFLIIAVLFSSCRMRRTDQENAQQNAERLDKERVEQDVREFVYPLPTSFELTEMLNRIGAAYILTLSNPVSNVELYLTEKERALNLGVYSTNLSYASTYNQRQATLDYMNVSKRLIDELNLSGAIRPDIIEQIEANQDNKDALVELISGTFYDTYEHLNQSGRGAVSMLVLAGSWVEGLYIATHISENTFDNKEMVRIVMEQKSSLNKLKALMQLYSENDAIAQVMQMLAPVHATFNSIEDGAITERQMKLITSQINTLRTEIIQ